MTDSFPRPLGAPDGTKDVGNTLAAERRSDGWRVSVVVPTLNSARFVDACLASICRQTYQDVEVIVIDGRSSDTTVERAKAYTANVHVYNAEKSLRRKFGAPAQRNYGAALATGAFIYYLDVDMVLPATLLETCVARIEKETADAVIIPERSFGSGFWAEVKTMERACYQGDDLVEAPRFFRRDVWQTLGGLDPRIGGAGDDWDLYVRLRQAGFSVTRISDEVLHDEGRLTLAHLARKHYMYGTDVPNFVRRHGLAKSVRHYNPVRKGYLANWTMFARHPRHLFGLVALRTIEYTAAGAGLVTGLLPRP